MKVKWKRKKVERIYDNHNQYGVRQLGERDYKRAEAMIRRFESAANFDEMIETLKRFRPHKLSGYRKATYSVDIGPKNRIGFRRTKRYDEVKVLYIDDHHD